MTFFLSVLVFLPTYLLQVHLQASKITSYRIGKSQNVDIKVYLAAIFLLVDEKIRIRTKIEDQDPGGQKITDPAGPELEHCLSSYPDPTN